MPLEPGKSQKAISRNIAVERHHGKSEKQAIAIAESNARRTGDREKDKRRCGLCGKLLPSGHPYMNCAACIRRLEKGEPAASIMTKAKDDLQPVGAEDPARSLALARHNSGQTQSQDKRGKDMKEELTPVGDAAYKRGDKLSTAEHPGAVGTVMYVMPDGSLNVRWDTPPSKTLPLGHSNMERWEPREHGLLRRAGDERGKDMTEELTPVGDRNPWPEFDDVVRELSVARKRLALAETREEEAAAMPEHERLLRKKKDIERAGPSKRAKDTELPMPIKTSNLVPRELQTRIEVAQHNYRKAPTQSNHDALQKLFAERKKAQGSQLQCANKALYGVGRDTELPVPIKTSNLVPLPTEMDDQPRYAGQRRGAARRGAKATDFTNSTKGELVKQLGKWEIYKMPDGKFKGTTYSGYAPVKGSTAAEVEQKIRGKAKATDSVNLSELRSGSDPQDHMARAAQYEVAGDRARALDSYRSAAAGYRKAGDRAAMSEAQDGIDACQARFATQYDHPSFGRVRVCDSASTAMQVAVARTRAGEDVRVDGRTVRPGRARDEHEGFKKLEGKLAHEKGVSDPAAVAAAIGRKKYGTEGMAKKAAAGRAKDATAIYPTEAVARKRGQSLADIYNVVYVVKRGEGEYQVVEGRPSDTASIVATLRGKVKTSASKEVQPV